MELNEMVFSKHLTGLPLATVGARLKAMGITAVDLTVRPGGHVEPGRAREDLPRAVKELGSAGVRVGMMTTEITDASDSNTAAILETASRLGIRYYKLGYYRYEGFGTLRRARDEVRARLKDLADMNRDLHLHGGYHNHCDDFLGASLADVEYVLSGIDPDVMGSYFDPTHATIEGGCQGWLMAMDRLSERITMLAVKDFRWVDGKHRYAGGRSQSVEFCPLGDGNAPWPGVLKVLRAIDFSGPLSYHSEYQGMPSFRDLSVEEVLQQTATDVRRFRLWVAEAARGNP